jgi:hypothetical protein
MDMLERLPAPYSKSALYFERETLKVSMEADGLLNESLKQTS